MNLLISLCPPCKLCPSFWSIQTAFRKTNPESCSPSFKEAPEQGPFPHAESRWGCSSSSPLAHFHNSCPDSFLSCCLSPYLIAPPVGRLGNYERQPCVVSLGQVPPSLAECQNSPAQRAHVVWVGTTTFLRQETRKVDALGKGLEFLRQFSSVLQPFIAEDVLTEERGSCHSQTPPGNNRN